MWSLYLIFLLFFAVFFMFILLFQLGGYKKNTFLYLVSYESYFLMPFYILFIQLSDKSYFTYLYQIHPWLASLYITLPILFFMFLVFFFYRKVRQYPRLHLAFTLSDERKQCAEELDHHFTQTIPNIHLETIQNVIAGNNNEASRLYLIDQKSIIYLSFENKRKLFMLKVDFNNKDNFLSKKFQEWYGKLRFDYDKSVFFSSSLKASIALVYAFFYLLFLVYIIIFKFFEFSDRIPIHYRLFINTGFVLIGLLFISLHVFGYKSYFEIKSVE